jgi:DNA-binding response OmpR family regulator
MGPFTPSGASVLLVESSAIIGLDLAEELERLGYGVVGPFACGMALQWVGTATPDLALLDVDLRSGPCLALARELRARRVPILVFSSHDRRSSLTEFHDLPWLSMPAPMDRLDAALRALATEREPALLPCG